MQTSLQIRYLGLPPSEAISAKIRQKVQKLEKIYNRITGCQVIVELPHNSKNKGNRYRVHIELEVPRETLVVNRNPEERADHQDAYVAIRDAFDSMRNMLTSYAKKQQHQNPLHHEEPPTGFISKLFPYEGYGFIATPDGREVYFNENSVVNENFADMKIGWEVRYAEEQGHNGPQASSLTVTRREAP